MKGNGESSVFKTRLFEIGKELRMLREQGIIDQMTYVDFLFLASNATTSDQLDQLTQDLAEICQARS